MGFRINLMLNEQGLAAEFVVFQGQPGAFVFELVPMLMLWHCGRIINIIPPPIHSIELSVTL
jgi:hypothetical protein